MEKRPAYFPLFFDLRGKTIVFIGGGLVATRRIRTLSGFDSTIRCISPYVTGELKQFAEDGIVEWTRKCYSPEDLEGAALVFACTDDPALNLAIAEDARAIGIPVNNCNSHEDCDFFFPAVVRRDDAVVGVISDGTSHSRVRELRKKIEAMIDEEETDDRDP